MPLHGPEEARHSFTENAFPPEGAPNPTEGRLRKFPLLVLCGGGKTDFCWSKRGTACAGRSHPQMGNGGQMGLWNGLIGAAN